MQYSAETAITTAVVARIKQLRTEARVSGAALAEAMTKLGFRWNQSTVAKLEAGRRRSIAVDELFALAVALDVPPIWLLIERSPEPPLSRTLGEGGTLYEVFARPGTGGLRPRDVVAGGFRERGEFLCPMRSGDRVVTVR